MQRTTLLTLTTLLILSTLQLYACQKSTSQKRISFAPLPEKHKKKVLTVKEKHDVMQRKIERKAREEFCRNQYRSEYIIEYGPEQIVRDAQKIRKHWLKTLNQQRSIPHISLTLPASVDSFEEYISSDSDSSDDSDDSDDETEIMRPTMSVDQQENSLLEAAIALYALKEDQSQDNVELIELHRKPTCNNVKH